MAVARVSDTETKDTRAQPLTRNHSFVGARQHDCLLRRLKNDVTIRSVRKTRAVRHNARLECVRSVPA